MPRLLISLWKHLSKTRRRQLILVLLLMVLSGFAEVVTLATVLPFLTALADPEKLWNFGLVKTWALNLGLEESGQLILPITILFVATATFASLIRTLNLWLSGQVAALIGSDLSKDAYRRTLYQPYTVHVDRNSSTVMTGILTHVTRLVNLTLIPLMRLVVSVIISIFIGLTLFVINPFVATTAMLMFGTAYFLILKFTRPRLLANSEEQARLSSNIVQAVQEGLGGIRDVHLDRSQEIYVERYNQNDTPLRKAYASAIFISESPAYAIEAIGITAIASFAFYLVAFQGGLAEALPLLGALAVGAQRLLPSLQGCYSSLSSIRNSSADLNAVVELLNQPIPSNEVLFPNPTKFSRCIEFKNLSFRYSKQTKFVFRDANFKITKGQRVGFIGPTGGGKSTAIDLLTGLLEPTAGGVLVDGIPINGDDSNVRRLSWQAAIATVPQSIFLADTSIERNVAFGVSDNDIDSDRVRLAIEQANLLEFVESLPEGFQTYVGERGVRLSGGQRQRVGIARAMYKNASVLILDEATSALDGATEAALMDSIRSLRKDLTIIMIAHRLSTLQWCDQIYEVRDGGIRPTILQSSAGQLSSLPTNLEPEIH